MAKKVSVKPREKRESVSDKLDRLEKKIDQIKRQQTETDKDVEETLEAAEETEKDVEGLERDIDSMEKDIDKIEDTVLKISRFSIGKRHLTDIARATAGAFIGVSVGMGLRWMPIFAQNMQWTNAIAILVFIFGLGAMLLYKTEKDWIEKAGKVFVFKRLTQMYVISIVVVIIAFYLFNMVPDDPDMFVKTVVVGTYPAMSGAITFTIT